MFLKKTNGPSGLSVPASGLYTCMTIISETVQPIKAKFYVEPSLKGGS